MAGSRYPDLLVSFDADPIAYYRSNGYIIAEQGKPPDFVLEIASASTGKVDVTDKRRDYARRRIREYWRFDETGEHHGTRLAGDRLVGDHYEEIPIDEPDAETLQGHSEVLDLDLAVATGRVGVVCAGDRVAHCHLYRRTGPRQPGAGPAPTRSRPAPTAPKPASASWKQPSASSATGSAAPAGQPASPPARRMLRQRFFIRAGPVVWRAGRPALRHKPESRQRCRIPAQAGMTGNIKPVAIPAFAGLK